LPKPWDPSLPAGRQGLKPQDDGGWPRDPRIPACCLPAGR